MGASYVDPFELRRLIVKLTRTPAGGISEDAVAFTLHLAKLTGGAPDANWLTADYTAVEARFDTWWTSMKVDFPAILTLKEYRWYKDGPVFSPADRADGPANPAARITTRSVVGTSANTIIAPPQLAATITKQCDIRKHWGRMYLPIGSGVTSDANGRFDPTMLANFLSRMVTCLNGCRADGKQPVVFSRGLSAHPSKRGGTIAAHVATAYEITGLVMDNLFDVVRSRRYGAPTVRTLTTLT